MLYSGHDRVIVIMNSQQLGLPAVGMHKIDLVMDGEGSHGSFSFLWNY